MKLDSQGNLLEDGKDVKEEVGIRSARLNWPYKNNSNPCALTACWGLCKTLHP